MKIIKNKNFVFILSTAILISLTGCNNSSSDVSTKLKVFSYENTYENTELKTWSLNML